MNRSLVLLAGLVALASLAACSNDSPAETNDDAPAAAEAEPEAVPPAGDPAPGLAAIVEEWAEPLTEAGYTVSFTGGADGLPLSDMTIAGPDGLAWSAGTISAVDSDGDELLLTPGGLQELVLDFGEDQLVFILETGVLRVGVRNENGDAVLVFEFTDVTTDAGSIATLQVTSVSAANGTAAFQLALDDYVLVTGTGGPFGSRIASIQATLDGMTTAAAEPGATGAVMVSSLALEWGLLQLTGGGVLSVDSAGAVSGRLDAMIVDVLAALDAVRASVPLDRGAMAETYAAILQEMGATPEGEALPFDITISSGAVTLVGEMRELPDFVLGAFSPLLAGQAAP